MIKKYTFLITLLFFCFFSYANANKYKIKDLEINLFDKNKQIKSFKAIREGFGRVEIYAFGEKIDDENVGQIILIVECKADKFGIPLRNFFLDYFFNYKNAIFNKEDSYLYIADKKKSNAIQIKEFNLEKFVKRSDDWVEIRTVLKNLFKKNSLKIIDTVIKSDHLYVKSSGNLVWVSYMYNYKDEIKGDLFQNGISKFHPKNINEFPKFKNYMDNWSNLALKRHDEFQEKLKIKSKIKLVSDTYDNQQNLDYYENVFTSLNINENEIANKEEEKERKAKEAKERKAKEEKERKAKEAKERKAKEEKERKAKEAKERKAKEEKERKAKEANERKAKEDITKSEDELSVDDLMSKIKELNEMYKSGIISKEEFEMLKNKLLKN